MLLYLSVNYFFENTTKALPFNKKERKYILGGYKY
jgi:hypothetical protein